MLGMCWQPLACAGKWGVLSSTLLEALEALETALDALGALVAVVSAAVWELALASRPANRNSFWIMSSQHVSWLVWHARVFPATGSRKGVNGWSCGG